jgi:hypothetical protein
MARLGAVIAQAIVREYGRDEFLARLAHPFWFQSFGAVPYRRLKETIKSFQHQSPRWPAPGLFLLLCIVSR